MREIEFSSHTRSTSPHTPAPRGGIVFARPSRVETDPRIRMLKVHRSRRTANAEQHENR